MPSRSRTVLVVLLGALATAAFSTTMAYVATNMSRMPQSLDSLASLNIAFWFGWATLSFPLVLLARRLRVDRRPRVAVPVHITAVVFASTLHIALLTTAQTLIRAREAIDWEAWPSRWMQMFPVQVATLIDWELVVGTCIVAVAHAFFYHAESRERGLAFDVDSDILDAIVPALILQPLVENAIKHGVIPTGRPGRVAVTGHREGEMIVLQVTDDGPGPSERAMAALSTGIGVSNTRARLTHQYGARHRFEFHRQPDAFSVLVAFPYRAAAQSRGDDTPQMVATVVQKDASEWPCPPEKSVL